MEGQCGEVHVERPRARTAVAVFTGEHDLATVDEVRVLLHSLIEENDLVVVDFSESTFVDSSMMHTLLESDRAARARGRAFRLQLGTAPIVETAFKLSGVLMLLDWVPTREEALRHAQVRAPG